MSKYDVIVAPEFKKEFNRFPKHIQERIRKILEKMKIRPSGKALKGDLVGFYSIHFERNKYRLIYTKEDNILKILAVHVGKRTNDFYKKFKSELKRRRKSQL